MFIPEFSHLIKFPFFNFSRIKKKLTQTKCKIDEGCFTYLTLISYTVWITPL